MFTKERTRVLSLNTGGLASVKKVREFPVPSRDVTTKLSQGGNNDVITELFLPRGSLVTDIPAGDGKLVNLFLRCILDSQNRGQEENVYNYRASAASVAPSHLLSPCFAVKNRL